MRAQLTKITLLTCSEGRATGIVTNTRVTHASPAGLYAHVADRNWECDKDITDSGLDDKLCDDIAEQLILNEPGVKLNVVMGGGSSGFLPKYLGGKRRDGKNLIDIWVNNKTEQGTTNRLVKTRDELMNMTETPDYLLGGGNFLKTNQVNI